MKKITGLKNNRRPIKLLLGVIGVIIVSAVFAGCFERHDTETITTTGSTTVLPIAQKAAEP